MEKVIAAKPQRIRGLGTVKLYPSAFTGLSSEQVPCQLPTARILKNGLVDEKGQGFQSVTEFVEAACIEYFVQAEVDQLEELQLEQEQQIMAKNDIDQPAESEL